jgi:hypothetical protein
MALQGRFNQAHLDTGPTHTLDSQTLKLTSSQYNTQWSRVLRSGGLNHCKSLCAFVFIPQSILQAKRLGPSSS